MNRNNCIVILIIISVIGAILSIHSKMATPANVYDNIGGGIYLLVNCSTTGTVSCTPATVPANHSYYMYSNATMTQLPEGTPLYRPN